MWILFTKELVRCYLICSIKVFIRHVIKGDLDEWKDTFLIFFRVKLKYVMCTKKKKKKKVAFITQIRQRKYLCSGKLCFLNKCTLWKKMFFFKNYDERQLYWASSKGIRGNIRKIWNFFSEIFSISFWVCLRCSI